LAQKINPKPNTILFDLDGVLVDSIYVWWLSFQEAFKQLFNLNLKKKEFDEIAHKTNHEIARVLCGQYQISNDNLDKIVQSAENFFLQKSKTHVQLKSYVKESIVFFKNAGFRLGVVTNGPLLITREIFDYFNILHHFEVIIACNGCTPKPSPELLLKALKSMEITKDECIYVGDSYTDFLACEQAGIRLIYYETERKHPQMKSFNGYRITNLSELKMLL
jgi:HAD superfamily hydrolase (TIGR01549 family)